MPAPAPAALSFLGLFGLWPLAVLLEAPVAAAAPLGRFFFSILDKANEPVAVDGETAPLFDRELEVRDAGAAAEPVDGDGGDDDAGEFFVQATEVISCCTRFASLLLRAFFCDTSRSNSCWLSWLMRDKRWCTEAGRRLNLLAVTEREWSGSAPTAAAADAVGASSSPSPSSSFSSFSFPPLAGCRVL